MKDRMRNQGRSAPDNKTYLIPSNLINLRAGKPNKNDIWIIISLFFLSPELLDRVRGGEVGPARPRRAIQRADSEQQNSG